MSGPFSGNVDSCPMLLDFFFLRIIASFYSKLYFISTTWFLLIPLTLGLDELGSWNSSSCFCFCFSRGIHQSSVIITPSWEGVDFLSFFLLSKRMFRMLYCYSVVEHMVSRCYGIQWCDFRDSDISIWGICIQYEEWKMKRSISNSALLLWGLAYWYVEF